MFALQWVAGTCRLGKKGDPDAVVDPKLRLIGIDCLRIVDASVFPDFVGTDQVRASDQHKNVEGTGPYIPASVSCTRGPSNGLIGMSAFRPKRTSVIALQMSVLPRADIGSVDLVRCTTPP
jgi:hypothetical protein